jgi:hypothetical protein
LLEEHSAEFRERVLRRVAEKDDLDAVAREFGLPPDLVFRWLRERADSAPPLAPRPSRKPPPSDKSATTGQADWPVIASMYAVLFVPVIVLFVAGHVRPSLEARRDGLPLWVLLGAGVFALLLRASNRGLAAREQALPTASRFAIAALFAVLSALSAWAMSLGLPTIPHRFVSTPVEVRTVVANKVIHRGKHTSYCLATPPFDDRIEPFDWCTSLDRFQQARIGETIVLHGTTSWFGFKDDHFDLVPGAPATVAASPVAPRQAAPAPVPQDVRFAPWLAGPAGLAAATAPATAVHRDAGAALRVKPGDDLATLRAAYPDAPSPAPYSSSEASNQQLVWLRDRGLRFFLTSSGTVNEVRLDAPFTGTVDGIGVGDALDTIQHQLGSAGEMPAHQPTPFGTMVLFTTSARYRIRVDLDADRRARTIFLFP